MPEPGRYDVVDGEGRVIATYSPGSMLEPITPEHIADCTIHLMQRRELEAECDEWKARAEQAEAAVARVREVVASWTADRPDEPECSHEGVLIDLPESDTWECAECGFIGTDS